MSWTPDRLKVGDVQPGEASAAPEELARSEADPQAPPDKPEAEELSAAELQAWLRHFGVC